MTENDIGTVIIGAAIKVHAAVGPGLLESAYETCLVYELMKRGLRVQTQVTVPLRYETLEIEAAYRADLIVENLVVVELKTVEAILPVHRSQLLKLSAPGWLQAGLFAEF